MDNIFSAYYARTLRVMRGVLALCTYRSHPRIRGFKSVSSQALKAHAFGNSGAGLANSMPVGRQRASPRIRMRGQRVGRRALRRTEPAHFSPRSSVRLLHRLAKRLKVLARLICFPHIEGRSRFTPREQTHSHAVCPSAGCLGGLLCAARNGAQWRCAGGANAGKGAANCVCAQN
jgi:hypothetical protein